MTTWIALFRGINVGGKNVITMDSLKDVLQNLKCREVRTYIQSGNVVFESAAKRRETLRRKIESAIEEQLGLRTNTLVISSPDFLSAVKQNPFPEATSDPKSLHLFFLDDKPKTPDVEGIEQLRAPTERYALVGDLFYLHAPDGIGRSKLAAKAEKLLGVAATARNFRTVAKLTEMIDSQ